jgi:hypothetical protein
VIRVSGIGAAPAVIPPAPTRPGALNTKTEGSEFTHHFVKAKHQVFVFSPISYPLSVFGSRFRLQNNHDSDNIFA